MSSNRKILGVLCLILVFNLNTPESHAEEQKFSDVKIGLHSYVPLQYFIEHDLVDGYEDGTFRPDSPVTRAEAITLIKKAVIDFDENKEKKDENTAEKSTEKNETEKKEQKFSDVAEDHWATSAIQYGIEQKIISGYENGQFMPDKNINLAEALKMVILAEKQKNPELGLEEKPADLFADVKTEDWFAQYAGMAKKRGMLRFGFKNNI